MSKVSTHLTAALVAVVIATATIVPVVTVPAADYAVAVYQPELA